MVARGRLFDEHVERRAGDLARRDRIGKRGFIDNSAARAVDDTHAFFHAGKRGRPDYPAGFAGERRVHRDEVRSGDQLIQRHQLDSQPRGRFGSEDRVEPDYLHLEPRGPVRDDPADIAETDHAESLVADLGAHELVALPLAGL